MSKTTQPKSSDIKNLKMDIKQKSTGENKTSKKVDARVQDKKQRKPKEITDKDFRTKKEQENYEKQIGTITGTLKKEEEFKKNLNEVTGQDYELPTLDDVLDQLDDELKTYNTKNYNIPHGSMVKVIDGFYVGKVGILQDRKIVENQSFILPILLVVTHFKIYVPDICEVVRVLSNEVELHGKETTD